jgi:hypothetical protein
MSDDFWKEKRVYIISDGERVTEYVKDWEGLVSFLEYQEPRNYGLGVTFNITVALRDF